MKIYQVIEIVKDEVTLEEFIDVSNFDNKKDQEDYFIKRCDSIIEDDEEYIDEWLNILSDKLISEGKYKTSINSLFLVTSNL